MRNSENKIFGIVSGVIVASFFSSLTLGSPAQAMSLPWSETPESEYFEGTNEFYDVTKDSRYYQDYIEIYFKKGTNLDETQHIIDSLEINDLPIKASVKISENEEYGYLSIDLENNVSIDQKVSEEKDSLLQRQKSELIDELGAIEGNKKFQESADTHITPELTQVSFNMDSGDSRVQVLNAMITSEEGFVYEAVDPSLTSIERINISSNKEMMDLIYQSEEEIQAMNDEIEAERRSHFEYNQSQLSLKEKVLQSVSFLSPINKTLAWRSLSNNVNNLVVYTRSNQNMVWDVDNANASNGQTFKMWGRSNHAAQQWKFDDSTGQIKFAGAGGLSKCIDVWLQNGSYDNGDVVSLYDCNSSKNNQKFVTYPDGTIRPKFASNMCLDASAGVNYGSKIHLWQCHGGSNQVFNAGEYDFDGQRFYIRV